MKIKFIGPNHIFGIVLRSKFVSCQTHMINIDQKTEFHLIKKLSKQSFDKYTNLHLSDFSSNLQKQIKNKLCDSSNCKSPKNK